MPALPAKRRRRRIHQDEKIRRIPLILCVGMFVNRAWTEIFVKPCPDEWFAAVEVSALVNSPKNNTPEILKPTVMVHTTDSPQRFLFDS
jgi:hypothetical protein